MKIFVLIVVLGCSPRDPPQRAAPTASPKGDTTGEARHTERHIDRDGLIRPSWAPPPEVVHFTTAGRDVYIDKTEVTVQAYRECVEADVCTEPGPEAILSPYREWAKSNPNRTIPKENRCPPDRFNWAHADRQDHPVNCVTFWQAWRYCQFRGKRLPVAYEWKAAAGQEPPAKTSKYPWGNDPISCDRAVVAGSSNRSLRGCAARHTMPVGSKPLGATPSGILDMSGNVAEIVIGDWESPESDLRVSTMGGSYADTAETVPNIEFGRDGYPGATVGFRCLVWPPSNGRDVARPIPNLPLPATEQAQ